MTKSVLFFNIVLVFFLLVSYYLHSLCISEPYLIKSYVLNALAASLVYLLAFFFGRTSQITISLFFLLGTVFKVLIFFVLIYPEFKQDGDQDSKEFFSFFIPYIICLIIETIFLVFLSRNNNKKTLEK